MRCDVLLLIVIPRLVLFHNECIQNYGNGMSGLIRVEINQPDE
jgi:hypothetical protein